MYKIIQNNSVIDVIKYPVFIKFLKTGHITITDKASAEGIVGSDNTPYSFIVNKKYKKVSITKINEKEFKRLQSLLNSGEKIAADSAALTKAQKDKIATLSSICKNKIIAGFTIELSDGMHKFKLTIEDQINLMTIENQIRAGETSFVYHATDEPCTIYSLEDMQKVIAAYKAHTLYHTTYFNAAKQYVTALVDIEKINRFNYGDDILDSVADPTLKGIIMKRGVC